MGSGEGTGMEREMGLSTRLGAAAGKEVNDEWLRARTLANLAAGLGKQHEARRIQASLPKEFGQTPGDRAFLYAAFLHARTQDDFYPAGRVHVGAVVLPAALVMLDAPERFLSALKAGYEVLATLSEGYSRIAQARGYRPTGLFGVFGAAAAAAVAAGLGQREIESAFGFAAAASGGTNQAWIEGTDEWLVEVASAARAGVEAALFAKAGLSGAVRSLDGQSGWAKAFFDDPAGERLMSALSDERPRTPLVAMKLFPVSGIAQVATALACQLGKKVRATDISEIRLYLSISDASYPGSASKGPFRSRSDALMSVPLSVAIGLAHGYVSYDGWTVGNGEARRLLGLVEIHGVSEIQDSDARLSVRTSAGLHEIEGTSNDYLFPSWEQTMQNIEGLATRCEAPLPLVKELATSLSKTEPSVDHIRQVLNRTLER